MDVPIEWTIEKEKITEVVIEKPVEVLVEVPIEQIIEIPIEKRKEVPIENWIYVYKEYVKEVMKPIEVIKENIVYNDRVLDIEEDQINDFEDPYKILNTTIHTI